MDIGKQQRVIKVEAIEAPVSDTTEPEPQPEIAEPEPTRPARPHRPAARPAAHHDG